MMRVSETMALNLTWDEIRMIVATLSHASCAEPFSQFKLKIGYSTDEVSTLARKLRSVMDEHNQDM